jgi:hypothetical protein
MSHEPHGFPRPRPAKKLWKKPFVLIYTTNGFTQYEDVKVVERSDGHIRFWCGGEIITTTLPYKLVQDEV